MAHYLNTVFNLNSYFNTIITSIWFLKHIFVDYIVIILLLSCKWDSMMTLRTSLMSALHPDLQLCPRFCFFAPLNISWIAYSLTHAWQTKRKEVATRAFVSHKTGFQTVLLDLLPFPPVNNPITIILLHFFFNNLTFFLKGIKIISINIIDRN